MTATLNICIVLVNIRNIHEAYSCYGPVHLSNLQHDQSYFDIYFNKKSLQFRDESLMNERNAYYVCYML